MGTMISGKPLAIVTGASSGIGLELAKQFAQHRFDLVIAAEDAGIGAAARELEALGAIAEPVQADLTRYEEVEKLWQRARATGRPVEAAAINAGVGVYGDFARETRLEDELRLIDLNVKSTVQLAKYVLGDMVARGRGHVLFTSSIAATMPTPLEAIYGASKAFILSFANSVRNELKGTGVSITALLPGPTETNFFHRAGMDDTRAGSVEMKKNSAADVARQGFEAMMAGKDRIVGASAISTKIEGIVSKYLPEDYKAKKHQKLAEHGSARR